MKNFLERLLLCTAAIVSSLGTTAQVSFGLPQSFNEGWEFILNPPASFTATSEWCSDKSVPVTLPHDWSVIEPMDSTLAAATGFLPGGVGWYRKTFEITDSLPNHYIYFEGVYNRSEVFLNGKKIGGRPNGYISTLYDMTPYMQPGVNELRVKADHSRYADSRWYTGSGIYRDVWLVAAGHSHLAPWGVSFETLEVAGNKARVKVGSEVANLIPGSSLTVRLFDADGLKAAEQTAVADTVNSFLLTVENPRLWSVDHPQLYTLEVQLADASGRVVDGTTSQVGLRTIKFTPDSGFFLNGENMKLKGVCLHHDAGVLGAAVPREVWERRLKNLKAIGVNAIRMSHNPQAPMVYELCDEIGLMVMDEASDEWEFPKRKWIKGWNVGEPGYDGSYDFFEEWIDRDVADMVHRDRLHPSIIMWSIGNEVDYPNDPYSHPVLDSAVINQPVFGGYNPDAPNAERIGRIALRLADVVRGIDASRPVTGALAGVVMSNETAYPQAVDVVGYNYTEDRYDMDHAAYPQRVIYGSENSSNYEAWKAVKYRDFIAGQFIWTGTDYLGESNGWPARGFYTGLLDFGSFTKPRGHFRASLWSEEPYIYLGTYRVPDDDPVLHPAEAAMHFDNSGPWLSIDADDVWNYALGDTIRVVCYTNSAAARLYLNGTPLGYAKPYDETTGIIFWDIPFSPGELTVVGFDGEGNEQAQYSIVTTGAPERLTVTVEDATGGAGIRHIVVDAVDAEGNRVKDYNGLIECTVEGDAVLLGLENSDNNDTRGFVDDSRTAYQGRVLAYVRKGHGQATVTFSAAGLHPIDIKL